MAIRISLSAKMWERSPLRTSWFLAFTLALMPGFTQAGHAADFIRTFDNAWLNSTATSTGETITHKYHPVMVDGSGAIIPWFSPNLGLAYDDALLRTWGFIQRVATETNAAIAGEKLYLFHQVWKENHDMRGIGGDQVPMFLSSEDLLYNYTGDPAVLANMRYQADYYLAHSLSAPATLWPNLPFPYNTDIHSGLYDGDMILHQGYTQPDKAGSFGFELVKLYKKTGDSKYLNAAIAIANTLAAKVRPGDANASPWPFKVHVTTGAIGSAYTSNWTPTLELFSALDAMGLGQTAAYKAAFATAAHWLKTYPVASNKWGPFFEDVPGWSDTQVNAMTYAMYLMQHPTFDPKWKTTVASILNWTHTQLLNKEFVQYKVEVMNEQTAYRVPGQSHSSRQASVELKYWALTGNTNYLRNDLRMLNWATYSIDFDGKNRYPRDDVWYTDGYGDFWRHLLRSMATAPQLAPDNANHLLETSSIVTHISYSPATTTYATYDPAAVEVFRLTAKPTRITMDGRKISEVNNTGKEGWMWQPLATGGVLRINHQHGRNMAITHAQSRASSK